MCVSINHIQSYVSNVADGGHKPACKIQSGETKNNKQMKYTRDTFNIRERIEGATRQSIILKGNDGEQIFCHNSVFNKIMQDSAIEFEIVEVPEHGRYPKTKWISAFLPTRIVGPHL